MTRPSPRPHPKKPAELGVTTQKTPSERLTGQPDKADKAPPKTQVTWTDRKWLRSETPVAFEAATFIKTGVDLAPADEQPASGGAE
jgi:hypothetical protein